MENQQSESIVEDLVRDQLHYAQSQRVFDRSELDGVLESVERSWNFTQHGDLRELQRVLSYIRDLHDSLPGELRPEPPDTLVVGARELELFFTVALQGVREEKDAHRAAKRLVELAVAHGARLTAEKVLRVERRVFVLAFDLLLAHELDGQEEVYVALEPIRNRFLKAPAQRRAE